MIFFIYIWFQFVYLLYLILKMISLRIVSLFSVLGSIDFASLYDFSSVFRNCSDIRIFFVFVFFLLCKRIPNSILNWIKIQRCNLLESEKFQRS
jgi:hypothetical protein